MSGAARTALIVDAGGGSAAGDAVESGLTRLDGVAAERVSGRLDDRPSDGAAGTDPASTDAADTAPAGVDAVFAIGEAAVLSLAADPPTCPVFAIDGDAGRYDVPADEADRAVDAFAAGAFETASHPVLAVAIGGDPVGAAIADVSLLTAEPARISEYGVSSPDGWADTVRADGIVVATPLGSGGYARAVGGPLLAPGAGLSVAPISPYAMHADTWVLRPPVSLSVERDEAAVSLLLDDAVTRTVPAETPVDVSVGATLSIVAPATLGGV